MMYTVEIERISTYTNLGIIVPFDDTAQEVLLFYKNVMIMLGESMFIKYLS